MEIKMSRMFVVAAVEKVFVISVLKALYKIKPSSKTELVVKSGRRCTRRLDTQFIKPVYSGIP